MPLARPHLPPPGQCPARPLPGCCARAAPPRRSGVLLLGLLLLPLLAAAAAAAAPAPAPVPVPVAPGLPDASFSVIRVFGALVLVLGLFLAGVWVFRNWQRLTLHRGRPSRLQVLEMRALGGKHVLYVVGYEHQRLLLSASPSGVALVSHLPAEDSLPLSPPQPGSPDFVQVLQQAVQGKP